jgi:hypothetical protein
LSVKINGIPRLELSPAQTQSFFEESLERVAGEAKDMLAAVGGAECIILVGGFSSSMYAVKRLRKELERQGRSLITPTYSRSAVLEGESVRSLHILIHFQSV